ncbi:MAG TPA: bacillithiol biosynthesis cysteine-adding enzyme BshC [Gemmatimonadales bacterium]|nr:bacillithiol biosynthesis cysteine-adding enzyme BshC [Gemmatimonadales bacterium]
MRIVTTPLPAPPAWPSPRPGGFPANLLEACLRAPGIEPQLERLARPDTLVVTTGQQPGLFTGPLYTIHKALSAAVLAELLEARWGRPVVPIFWVAGDDHDFAEANHASWLDGDGTVVTATLRTRPPEAPLTPMYREPLGPEVLEALARLEASLPPSEFREPTLEWVRRHYRPEETVAGAYGRALAELLAPAGVVCFDSTHPAAKRAAAPLLLRALGAAHELDADLATRAVELEAGGRGAGVTVGEGATLVMLEARLGRDRLVASDGGFATRRSGERFDPGALEAIAHEAPERLSPNVLLRPVVESALLPTVAYLAGPGELRYLELTPPVYRRLGVVRQLPVPRWSGILVEPRVDRVLAKFGADLAELLAPGGALEARVVRTQLPGEAGEALQALRGTIEAQYARLERIAIEIDPTLAKPIRGLRNAALVGTQDAEKRLLHHLKRRQETDLRQIARGRAAVLPDGKPQERVLTVVPFLARYGFGLVGTLVEEIRRWYRAALEAPVQPA